VAVPLTMERLVERVDGGEVTLRVVQLRRRVDTGLWGNLTPVA